jgi:Cdc6-like AAA superfamily ATPase
LSSRRFYGLVRELSVLGLLDTRVDNFGRRGGRVTTISLEVGAEMINKALSEDVLIGEVFSHKIK